jgi:hypothetical protein
MVRSKPSLLLLGVQGVDQRVTLDSLPLLLKYQQDIEKARAELVSGPR